MLTWGVEPASWSLGNGVLTVFPLLAAGAGMLGLFNVSGDRIRKITESITEALPGQAGALLVEAVTKAADASDGAVLAVLVAGQGLQLQVALAGGDVFHEAQRGVFIDLLQRGQRFAVAVVMVSASTGARAGIEPAAVFQACHTEESPAPRSRVNARKCDHAG